MKSSVGRLVSILYRKNQVYLNGVLKPLNITAAEVPVLIHLFGRDGISQEELSSFLVIDKAATARVVQSLLDKGFYARIGSE
jgi:DNA-binding MarR family transcriptional regulator